MIKGIKQTLINLTALWSYLLHLLKHASHSLLHLFELAKSFLHFVKRGQFLLHISQGSLQLCNFVIPCLTWLYLKVRNGTLATSATWAWTKSYPTNTTFVLLTHHFGKHIIRCTGNTTTCVKWLQLIQRFSQQLLHLSWYLGLNKTKQLEISNIIWFKTTKIILRSIHNIFDNKHRHKWSYYL